MRFWISAALLGVGIALGVAANFVPSIRDKVAALAPASTTAPKAGAGDSKTNSDAREPAHISDLVKMTNEQIASQDIKLAPVQGGTISRRLIAPGTIMSASNRLARVPARVVGTLSEMRKQLGDPVAKGEVVALVDSREVADAKGEFLTAQVNADLQKTYFERAQSLWDKRVSSENVYLQARATNAETQLRLNLARQKLSALGLDARNVAAAASREQGEGASSSLRQFELRSPIAGRVVERRAEVGMAVGKEGDPADVYTIADLTIVWIDIAVPTAELDRVKEGESVLVTASNDEGARAEGRVIFVSPVLNTDTRSARVIAELANRDQRWRPGAFVSADILTSRETVPLMIPKAALQTINGEPAVFVRTEEGFQRRDVKLGRSDETSTEVTTGVTKGEVIAVGNSFLLKAELGKAGAKHDD